MNYSEILEKYELQGWNEETKLNIILQFLDLNANRIITPRLFDQFLKEIQDNENSIENSI